jgi:hypothetical protein
MGAAPPQPVDAGRLAVASAAVSFWGEIKRWKHKTG